jgi:GDPmannose 4,6-dehydratase
LGDPSNAKVKLGWVPEITVHEMCTEMVKSDLEEAKRIKLLQDHGYDVSLQLEG